MQLQIVCFSVILQEHLVYQLVYLISFKGGKKPPKWTIQPPTKADLINFLESQLSKMNEQFSIRTLDGKLENPFFIRGTKFEIIGEVLGFVTIHEVQNQRHRPIF
ncbi:MAG: hypothetical protein ACQEV7_11220 [Bacillota bacterium]